MAADLTAEFIVPFQLLCEFSVTQNSVYRGGNPLCCGWFKVYDVRRKRRRSAAGFDRKWKPEVPGRIHAVIVVRYTENVIV